MVLLLLIHALLDFVHSYSLFGLHGHDVTPASRKLSFFKEFFSKRFFVENAGYKFGSKRINN